MSGKERTGKKGLSLTERLFPPRYDFYKRLQSQADETVRAVSILVDWLRKGDLSEPRALAEAEQRADDIRHEMENELVEAFSTPFDRQDIYSVSRQMDYIVNWSLSTAVEMRSFDVRPDPAMLEMAEALLGGAKLMSGAIGVMHSDPYKAEALVPEMRGFERKIDETYVRALTLAFKDDDLSVPLRKREIYHHLRDAGRNFIATVDILHRIIVGTV